MKELVQIAEKTKESGTAIGESLKSIWTKCKKNMKWYEILKVKTLNFFDA